MNVTQVPELLPQVIQMLSSQLDKTDAGALLRARREHLSLTQEQVAEQVGIPTITQLSEYENGKVNVARSKYFPALAKVLRLTQEEVRAINPSAVFDVNGQQETKKTERTGRRPLRLVSSSIYGDMNIPALPASMVLELTYDKKPTEGLLITKDPSGRYWLYLAANVPSGHSVEGSLRDIHFDTLSESPRAN